MADKAKKVVALPNQVEDGKKPRSGGEIGDSGTRIYEGLIYEEYNPKLHGRQGLDVFDEMRKSDGTVRAAVLACVLPVMQARWFVKPASDDGEEDEVSIFVSKCLFEMMEINWNDFLRQSMLCLPFGFMVFEKVFTVAPVDGIDRIVWEKFAPRMPRSIFAWQTTEREPGIQQQKTDGHIVSIPVDKLLVFVNEKEGDNYQGTSILRAAYKHWHMKNTFYKIDAIAAERQGLGVPYATLPPNFTEIDETKAKNVLQNMRSNEQAYAVIPEGWEIGFMDMKSNTVRDLSPSVAHHDRQISKSVLAQFLELGQSSSGGSRALSKDQSELFLQSLEAIAANFQDVMNKTAIRELVDLNFPGTEEYPTLDHVGISRVDTKVLSETYSALITSGGVHTDPIDEQFFRETMGLPERSTPIPIADPNAIDPNADPHAHPTDPKLDPAAEKEALAEVGMSEFIPTIKKKIYPERKEIAAAIASVTADLSAGYKIALLKRSIGNFSQFSPNHRNASLFSSIRGELTAQLAQARKVHLEDSNDYKGFRPMTFAEKKVDFKSIEKNLDRIEEQFDKDTQALLHAQREIFVAKLSKALAKDDKAAIKAATMEAQTEYARIIRDAMKEAYQYGKENASTEIGQKTPANVKKVIDQIEVQADAIAGLHIAEITSAAKNAMIDTLNKGESTAQALAAADAAISAKILEVTVNTSRIAMAGYVNHGRASVFEQYRDITYALQRSELLDSHTCNYCLSVDGRIVEKDDSFAQNTIFHSGCRGIWVAILLDEAELPPIGGIPNTVRDRFGDVVNDLIQPREPITKKNSAARKEVERRAKRKANDK